MLYPALRDLLFHLSPEKAHKVSMLALQTACSLPPVKSVMKKVFQYKDPQLERELMGLHFPNPVGLGAGFDKNALYLRELEVLGFGFVEIGTVTPKGQPGNPQPRLFRLPQDKALINRMGFNNEGVDRIRERLEKWHTGTGRNSKMIIGGNIGKNKLTPNEEAWKDYETCFRGLFEQVDYFVVNVSSPNTPGLRALQEKDALLRILDNLQQINTGMLKPKPLLLKIAPDLTSLQIDDIIEISRRVKLNGLVVNNTTIARDGLLADKDKVAAMGAGGLSGLPLTKRSQELLQYVKKGVDKDCVLMASGGIFTGQQAADRIAAGAPLVQVWTGFIYEGPMIARNICKYIARNIPAE